MRAIRTNWKDVDSVNVEVYDNSGNIIAEGSYNIKTNFAHISTMDGNYELEDSIVEGIENRTIELN